MRLETVKIRRPSMTWLVDATVMVIRLTLASRGVEAVQAPAEAVLSQHAAWRQVPAIRDGRIHVVSGAWLTSVSQDSVRGVEVIAELLHPDAFDAAD